MVGKVVSTEHVRHWKAKLSVPKVAASERLSAYSVGQWPEKKKEQGRGVACLLGHVASGKGRGRERSCLEPLPLFS